MTWCKKTLRAVHFVKEPGKNKTERKYYKDRGQAARGVQDGLYGMFLGLRNRLSPKVMMSNQEDQPGRLFVSRCMWET
jgi:hypothetical protein